MHSLHGEGQLDPEGDPAHTEVWLHDGGLVRGNLLDATGDTLKVATDFSRAPLAIPLARCRALVFPRNGQDEEPEQDLGKLDRIAAGGLSLPGTITATGGTLPSFHPIGCEAPLPPAAAPDLTLTRSLPSDRHYQRAAALLHTTTRESLPVS
ncbi:MAG: hypothetical protein GWO24_07985, partial [Akkermansiaceae bacterium]|nr:hypothetical protein [Akkermansiaceae bacterium]